MNYFFRGVLCENFRGFSKNGGKTVDRSIDWVRGNFSDFFKWNFWGRKKVRDLGSCGNFREKINFFLKKWKVGVFEISRKKNGILKSSFFLIFFIKIFSWFYFCDFFVLRAIFCDCQTPLRENKLELRLSGEKKCLAMSRVLFFLAHQVRFSGHPGFSIFFGIP